MLGWWAKIVKSWHSCEGARWVIRSMNVLSILENLHSCFLVLSQFSRAVRIAVWPEPNCILVC